MKFVQIPNIENALGRVTIKTLSPSTFSWICNECAYQVLLQKALSIIGKECELPLHKNTMLGIIVHRIYEKTSKGEISTLAEMKDLWESLVLEQEQLLAENYPTLRNPNINDYDKRNKAIKYAWSIVNKRLEFTTQIKHSENKTTMYTEKKLDCNDIGLCGIADKIIVNNGDVNVIDYKSGHVHGIDGNIKSEYVVQLHLYAAMCEHIGLGKVKSLSLIDIDGVKHDADFIPEYCISLIGQVSEKIQLLNEAISQMSFDHLVKSDSENCCSCSCRHVCRYMQQSETNAYRTISGIVDRIPSSNMYVVRNGGRDYYISGLDVYSVNEPESYVGTRLVFLNVVKSSQVGGENTFKITENTLVYELL